MLDNTDFGLLYMMKEAEDKGTPISTWYLAQRVAKSVNDRNRLDGVFRHRLTVLATIGLVHKHIYKRNNHKCTCYTLNPKRFTCHDGSLFIIPKSSPIHIIACQYLKKCPSKCHPIIYKPKNSDTVIVRDCPLLKEASTSLKDEIYAARSKGLIVFPPATPEANIKVEA